MVKSTRNVLIAIVAIAIFLISCFFVTLYSSDLYAYFAPRQASIDNKIFHESAQYTDGMKQRLDQLQEEYIATKDADGKAAIKSMTRHEFAAYPDTGLNDYQQKFIKEMRSN